MRRFELIYLTPNEFTNKCRPELVVRRYDNIPQELKEHILKHGILYPVIVDKDYVIIDGVSRWYICKEYGNMIKGKVPILRSIDISFKESPVEFAVYILANYTGLLEDEPLLRKLRFDPLQRAKLVKVIYDETRSLRKTAELIGVSHETVRLWLSPLQLAKKIGKIDEEKVLDKMADKPVALSVYDRVSRLKKKEIIEDGVIASRLLTMSDKEREMILPIVERLPRAKAVKLLSLCKEVGVERALEEIAEQMAKEDEMRAGVIVKYTVERKMDFRVPGISSKVLLDVALSIGYTILKVAYEIGRLKNNDDLRIISSIFKEEETIRSIIEREI